MYKNKINLRPIIKIENSKNYNDEENFQNNTLRPIIKLQHDLLLLFFKNHIKRKKIKLSELKIAQQKELIDNVLKNDNHFKNELRGMIIGLFTTEEYIKYSIISNAINKRIISMIKKRFKDSM